MSLKVFIDEVFCFKCLNHLLKLNFKKASCGNENQIKTNNESLLHRLSLFTGVRAPPVGCGLQHERGKLDVVERVRVLPPLQQDVPPRTVRQKVGPDR